MKTIGPGESSLLFLDVIEVLDKWKVPYAIIGAFAASFYGLVRASLDVDAVISVEGSDDKLRKLLSSLEDKKFNVGFRRGDFSDPVKGVINIEDKVGNRVDLLIGIRGMKVDIYKRVVPETFMNRLVRIVGIEDLIAMKIYAGSAKDIQDVVGVLQVSGKRINLPLLKKITGQYGKKELEKLGQLLTRESNKIIQSSRDIEVWLKRETPHKRKALENASAYFDKNDKLTVNTLEAIYAQESSFGTQRNKRGIASAAGDFHLQKDTAKRYHLIVSSKNDQRFDIDFASIAAARYLKDLDNLFLKQTRLSNTLVTLPVKDSNARKKFVLAAYNGGEGTIAKAQFLAQKAGKNPANWDEVQAFLEEAHAATPDQIREYVEKVPANEAEFAQKSLADKKVKDKRGKEFVDKCINGHWITKDDHHIFICN